MSGHFSMEYANDHEAHEEMVGIISHLGNAIMPIRMASIKKSNKTRATKDVEKLGPLSLLVGI
jgi:hypothetical protein